MTASYTAACTYDMYRLPSIWNFAGAAARTVFTAITFQSSATCGEIFSPAARDVDAPSHPSAGEQRYDDDSYYRHGAL